MTDIDEKAFRAGLDAWRKSRCSTPGSLRESLRLFAAAYHEAAAPLLRAQAEMPSREVVSREVRLTLDRGLARHELHEPLVDLVMKFARRPAPEPVDRLHECPAEPANIHPSSTCNLRLAMSWRDERDDLRAKLEQAERDLADAREQLAEYTNMPLQARVEDLQEQRDALRVELTQAKRERDELQAEMDRTDVVDAEEYASVLNRAQAAERDLQAAQEEIARLLQLYARLGQEYVRAFKSAERAEAQLKALQAFLNEHFGDPRDAYREALKDVMDVLADTEQPADAEDWKALALKTQLELLELRLAVDSSGNGADARRYRRLRVLGCAPSNSSHLREGLVLRFTNLDAFIDDDLSAHPSRGEATEQPAEAPTERNKGRTCICGTSLEAPGSRYSHLCAYTQPAEAPKPATPDPVDVYPDVDPQIGYCQRCGARGWDCKRCPDPVQELRERVERLERAGGSEADDIPGWAAAAKLTADQISAIVAKVDRHEKALRAMSITGLGHYIVPALDGKETP